MSKIKVDPMTLALLFLSLIYAPLLDILPVLCAISVHELAHIISAKIMKIQIKEFELNVLGARIHTKNNLFSYRGEIMLAVAGPLINIVMFALIFMCKELWVNDGLKEFALCNLALGLLNLLPIESFDGGRILNGFLSRIFSLDTVTAVTRFISFVIMFSLWMLSVYFLLRSGATIALFAFCITLFSKMIRKDIFV